QAGSSTPCTPMKRKASRSPDRRTAPCPTPRHVADAPCAIFVRSSSHTPMHACTHARGFATLHVMASYGRCEASLRDGRRCRVVIETEGAAFCPHHLRLAQ